MKQIWIFLLLPYFRLELPGWGKLMHVFGQLDYTSSNQSKWPSTSIKTIRGKLHGYLMTLDLSDWSQRYTYLLGRYYEKEVQLLMKAALKPGDRFVDIGANIGMISLYAAYLVTDKGTVNSFEPNPDCIAAIESSVKANHLTHVKLYPVALADKEDKLQLNLSSAHTGTATLAKINDTVKSFEVDVVIGDNLLLIDSTPIKMVKIDVEGFELRALKGIKKSLELSQPMLITEFIDSHFERAGTSSNEIKIFISELGYKPYGISLQRKWFKHRLQLVPLSIDDDTFSHNDILWLNKENPHIDILNKYT